MTAVSGPPVSIVRFCSKFRIMISFHYRFHYVCRRSWLSIFFSDVSSVCSLPPAVAGHLSPHFIDFVLHEVSLHDARYIYRHFKARRPLQMIAYASFFFSISVLPAVTLTAVADARRAEVLPRFCHAPTPFFDLKLLAASGLTLFFFISFVFPLATRLAVRLGAFAHTAAPACSLFARHHGAFIAHVFISSAYVHWFIMPSPSGVCFCFQSIAD